MIILAVGLNHKTAPVEVRERLAFPAETLGPALAVLKGYVAEGVILSTCNRTEVYGLVGHVPTGAANLRRFLADFHRVPQADFEPYLYTLEHLDAVRHLFAVASGLDSMVLGEHQVLGQVRRALEAARAA
ncbi:MAG: glutamyl-tRNA reductase, partial [Chloroflexota bacterium]